MLLLAGGLSIAFAQNTGVNPGDRATDAAAAAETDDRFYVEFRQFGPASAAAVEALGGRVVHRFPELNAVAARLPQQAYRMLLNNPNVVAVEADPRRYRYAVSDTVVGGETTPYGIKMVQADQVASGNHGSRKVCIIDSGYYMAHEDLQPANVTASPDGGTGDPFTDNDGHGTHVAGTVAALAGNGTGVRGVIGSGNLKLHIVKVFGDDGAWAYSSDLVAALGQCRTAGANVVSMSLGGSFSSRYEQNAFANAYSAGVLSVAAAGNAGSSRKSYPASYSSVISVAAVDSNETVAPFSQYNDAVELAAPGVAVLSTVPYEDTSKITVGAVAITGNHVEFSARTSSAGVTGTLVEGGLCTANPGTWSGKIVHCQRGDISFYDKVRNVQLGGGTAVVISNNVEGDLYATLGSGNSSTIPAIGVTQAAGTSLAGLAGQSGTVVSLVQKPYSGYSKYDGTSMATPHVSGVAALVWSHGTSWTNVQIREALQASAKDLGAAGRDNYYGYGLVQAKAALDRLNGGGGGGGGTDTTPPVISGVQARVTNAKNGSFEITWTTDEPATSTVTFAGGALGSKTSTALVTSHRIAFKGTKGASYTFTVSSTDAAGNTATSGPFPHEN
jgi:serine protease